MPTGGWRGRSADQEPPDAEQALGMAYRLLAGREHSRLELRDKLTRRGVEGVIAREVLERLERDGLVNDARFAESFVRQRVASYYGPYRIRLELRARGVDDALIEEALEPHTGAWRGQARAWVARRHAGSLDRKAKGRLYRGGQRRGFSHDHIMRAIEWLEAGEPPVDEGPA